jgi:hypothetical protein
MARISSRQGHASAALGTVMALFAAGPFQMNVGGIAGRPHSASASCSSNSWRTVQATGIADVRCSRSAACARHALTSSATSCGHSASRAASDMRLARYPRTSATLTRVPRTYGLPNRTAGSTLMRFRRFMAASSLREPLRKGRVQDRPAGVDGGLADVGLTARRNSLAGADDRRAKDVGSSCILV